MHRLLILLLLVSCTRYNKVQPINIPIVYKGKEMYQNIRTHEFTVNGKIEKVKKGFVYDGASVPRIVWTFMPPDGLHREGALIHDWCYVHHGVLKNITITKEDSDKLFYEYMIEDGVGKYRAWIAYKAVSLFGHDAWNSKDEIIILPVCLH